VLFGGSGQDRLTGGPGSDLVFGEADNDRLIWNPGDDNDFIEGGSEADTVEINGSNGAEAFTTTANGTRVRCSTASARSPSRSTSAPAKICCSTRTAATIASPPPAISPRSSPSRWMAAPVRIF
jgi:hypothetical protein